MAKMNTVVSYKFVILFLPFASYLKCGDVSIFRFLFIPIYVKAGDSKRILGFTFSPNKNWVFDHNAGWRHRPLWKVVFNTIMRTVQKPFTGTPLVIGTIAEDVTKDKDVIPRAVGYKFARVAFDFRGSVETPK